MYHVLNYKLLSFYNNTYLPAYLMLLIYLNFVAILSFVSMFAKTESEIMHICQLIKIINIIKETTRNLRFSKSFQIIFFIISNKVFLLQLKLQQTRRKHI